MGHPMVTVGHPRVTIGHFKVTIGHYRITICLIFSISKHKANTTELHPNVRQTCYTLKLMDISFNLFITGSSNNGPSCIHTTAPDGYFRHENCNELNYFICEISDGSIFSLTAGLCPNF